MTKRFSSKIKGIFKVSSSNIIALMLSMLTSFLLPIFISVEEYGYWQLFVLYVSYTGFFVLGFNDGVHLNYANYDYDEPLTAKFKSFGIFLSILSLLESIILTALLFVFTKEHGNMFFILLLCILNIFPQAIIGLFTYMNQSTLRFSQYAIGNIFDKIVFATIMVVLLLAGVKDSSYYIASYTFSRYLLLGYHWYSSRLVFSTKKAPMKRLKEEIVKNFKDGFPLMIATILNGSIIVGSRLLVQGKYGIESFSAFSFSIHTIVVATQFISAIATVFYPIMKRSDSETLPIMYMSFDKISTIISSVLLLSYYLVIIVVKLVYSDYIVILDYLFWVYPLFIFNCKSNLLVTNFYKVRNLPNVLILTNGVAIILHLLFAFGAYYLFGTIESIAASVLISYCLWYYVCQVHIYRTEKWKIQASVFYDIIIVFLFIVVAITTNELCSGVYMTAIVGFVVFLSLCAFVYLFKQKQINDSILEFSVLLQD